MGIRWSGASADTDYEAAILMTHQHTFSSLFVSSG